MGRTSSIGLFLVVLIASVGLQTARATAAEPEITFVGGGWGHSVGMSQYGAKAMASAGWTAEQIIEYYYSGAVVTPLGDLGLEPFLESDPEPLWIGLRQSVGAVDLEPFGPDPLEVCDGDTCTAITGHVRVAPNGADCLIGPAATWPTGSVTIGCSLDIDLGSDPATGVEVPGVCAAGDCRYGRGVLHVRPASDGLHVVLELSIDEYLYGLAEVPSSWPAEALGAQVITARSYALRKADAYGAEPEFSTYRRNLCWCHLYDDTRDQAYRGLQWEAPSWRAAVDAASGDVVSFGGSIISTFYSSSTGGWTEDVEDVWGGSPVPYLRSVEDPWSVSPAAGNPYASWAKTVSASTVAAKLGWDQVSSATLVEPAPGARVRFTGADGGVKVTKEISGETARIWFGLRSGGLDGVTFVGFSFVDIGSSQHASAIIAIAEAGITRGCNPPTNDEFCPTGTITRGQLAAFFTRALGLPTPGGDWFDDDDGSVFESDIEAIAAAGITKGCNPPANTRFCPDEPVTRGQAAAFFARALGLPNPGGDWFTDDDASIFEFDIEALAAEGITRGCNPPANTRFCPDDPITREQFATFLFRAFLSG